MKILKIVTLAFVLSLLMVSSLFADIKMPKIFSNSMILQRGESVNIWGTSSSDAKVEVEFAEQKAEAKADAKGAWKLALKPMKASSQGRSMKIYENGKLKKTISDILVGEVWIAGGQSNMAFALKEMKDSKQIVAEANNSLIRYFDQGSCPPMKSLKGLGSVPLDDVQRGCRWLVCSPKNAEHSFKAVPYIFARDVAKKLNVPVGIVYTAIPGTRMVSWIPREDFEKNPAFASAKADFEARVKKYDPKKAIEKFENDVATFKSRVERAKKEGKTPPAAWTVSEQMRPWQDSPDKWMSPVMLYNIRVHPIEKFTARGIIWYQGESDSNPQSFDTQFEGFIKVWRRLFSKPNMPFVFVQLPSYSAKSWSEIRLSQDRVMKKMKNVYMATTVDTGDKSDIHPTDKLYIGERLARLSLANVYGQKDVRAAGPIFKQIAYNGSSVVVTFDTNGVLKFKGKARGFEVLVNGKWEEPKSLQINGKTLTLESKNGKIDGVRYLYKSWAKPDVSLYDEVDLPAYPFYLKK